MVSPRFSFTAFELSFSGVERNCRDEVIVVVTDLSRRFFFDPLFPSVFFDLARSFGGESLGMMGADDESESLFPSFFFDLARSFGGPSFGMMGADDDSEFTAVRDLFAWVGRSLAFTLFFPETCCDWCGSILGLVVLGRLAIRLISFPRRCIVFLQSINTFFCLARDWNGWRAMIAVSGVLP